MKTWTLEDARAAFTEIIQQALQSQPQRVTRGGDAVVVVNAKDYAAMSFARDLIAFIQRSDARESVVSRPADVADRTPEAL